ncbi:MAG: FAD:protein FMN transferase [Clostridia bacterium]|nr:FAD:protein FMN transferase [Clostridia bacterium]
MKSKKVIFGVAAILAVVLLVTLIGRDTDFEKTTYAMAAAVGIKLSGKNCEETAEKINDRIVECENREISRNAAASDVSKINAEKTYTVSDKTVKYISQLKDFSSSCSGAVDITVGELTRLWNIGGEDFKVPGKSEIEQALSSVGYEQIKIINNNVSIGKNQSLDLGCAGKGIACDEALEIIETSGVKRAVISVGGSILLWSKDSNEEFTVGIRDPHKSASDYCMTVKTENTFVSTSGTYERFSIDKNGKEYHHILSTTTGYPVENDVLSVTVFCQSGLLSDSLSSACLILGYEKSEELLKKYDASAVYIFKDNTVKTSSGFEYELNVRNNEYVLK